MDSSEKLPGRYVRVEGSDGVGKTTQLNLARKYAENNTIDTLFIREPGGTDFGIEIRNLVLHNKNFGFAPQTEYALFTADRIHLALDKILPALEAGYTVISDRGIESSIAYQSLKGVLSKEDMLKIGELLLPEWYMKPDALALLSLSKEARRRRMADKSSNVGLDKIESRTDSFFEDVDTAYKDLESLPYATVIDADKPPEILFNELRPVLFGKEYA